MLVVTLAAVCLGLLKLSPGYGILLILVATPALVRTMVATGRRKQAGERLTTQSKILEFVASMFVTVVAGLAAQVAFAITCTTGLFAGMLVSLATPAGATVVVGCGLVAALITAIVIFSRLLERTLPPKAPR
jgi:hypothetical protein